MSQTTVHILLATYNGARFLREQLASIARQSHTDWRLTVSDDGSSDETLLILKRFAQESAQPVTLLRGPGRGPTHNFFHLIAQVQHGSKQDLFAFADQDDVWLEDKLSQAVEWHDGQSDQPFRLYCGRTRYVDDSLHPIGESRVFKRPPGFGHALVQNIASGNTMIFSQAVLSALQTIRPEHSVWHDWTTYLVTTATGGQVYCDDIPLVLYRQHTNNVIGANKGLKAQFQRLIPIFQGRYRYWSDLNLAAMRDINALLPETTRDFIQKFERMRNSESCGTRVRNFLDSGIRRQGLASNTTLLVAIILKLA